MNEFVRTRPVNLWCSGWSAGLAFAFLVEGRPWELAVALALAFGNLWLARWHR